MSGIRLLDLIKPFASLVPEIELPYEKTIFDEKVVWTIAAAAIYLFLGLPLNGVNDARIADPFAWLRDCFGSSSGTLLEFGVFPAAFSAFVWQIAAGTRLLKIDFHSSYDRQLFQTLQKVTSIVLGLVLSLLLVFSGYFTPIDYFLDTAEGASIAAPSIMSQVLLVLELTASNTIITLMVELLDKAYGFGPGVLAYVVVAAAATLTTSFVGITTMLTPRGSESTGAVVQLVRNFFSKKFTYAIYEAFTRDNLTNLAQVFVTAAAFCGIVYWSNCRQEISIKSSKARGMVSVYPVKLVYCGALPLVFTYSILYLLNVVVFALTRIFADNKYLALLGVWELEPAYKKTYNLTSGLLYFVSASPSTESTNVLFAAVRPFTYTAFVVAVSTLFGKSWPSMSGSAGKDVARQFKSQDISVMGRRDAAVSKELDKLIKPAALAGSFLVSVTAALAEAFGSTRGLAYGTIVGVLGGLSIMEELVSEWQQTGAAASSQLSQFIPTQ